MEQLPVTHHLMGELPLSIGSGRTEGRSKVISDKPDDWSAMRQATEKPTSIIHCQAER